MSDEPSAGDASPAETPRRWTLARGGALAGAILFGVAAIALGVLSFLVVMGDAMACCSGGSEWAGLFAFGLSGGGACSAIVAATALAQAVPLSRRQGWTMVVWLAFGGPVAACVLLALVTSLQLIAAGM